MFCASCIEEHFREILKKKLALFRQRNSILDIITVPKTLAQRKIISRLITSHQGDSSDIFSYDCPHCRKVVKEAPVLAYQLRSLLSEARTLLSGYLADDDMPPADELPVTFFFDSLFE
jgi:predicted PP-loop superfamily ATPase